MLPSLGAVIFGSSAVSFLKQLRVTPLWLMLAGMMIIGSAWTLFVVEYRYQLLEDPDVNKRALLVTLSFSVGMTAALTVSGPKARGVIAKLLSVIVFGIGSFVAIFGLLLTVNALLDRSHGITHYTTVIESTVRKGKPTRYRVVVNSWRSGESAYAMFVSRSRYETLNFKPGDCVMIGVGEGALGFPWIASLENLVRDESRCPR